MRTQPAARSKGILQRAEASLSPLCVALQPAVVLGCLGVSWPCGPSLGPPNPCPQPLAVCCAMSSPPGKGAPHPHQHYTSYLRPQE